MVDVLLKRTMAGFEMASDSEGIKSIKLGEVVKANIVKPRNLKLLRKYWALISAVFPHQEAYATTDGLEERILVGIGHCEDVPCLIKNPATGKVEKATRLKAKSISFAKCEDETFNQIYEAMVAFILLKILPNVDRAELEAQVLDILKGREAA